MNENTFKPGDQVRHIHSPFDHIELFVVKILESGAVVCR